MDIKTVRQRQQINPSLCKQTWGISGVEDLGSLQLEQSLPRAVRKRSMAAAVGKQLHGIWNWHLV